MMRFTTFRAKDPVLAVILSMGLVFAAPAITRAQSNDWEEVGPAGQNAQQQLMSAPPRVVATALGQTSYRPPVEPPANVSRNAAVNTANAAPVAQNHYVVQAGDTLPKIAMKVYGDANRWQDLMVLNNIENGNRIFVGQQLVTVASNSSASRPAVQASAQDMQRHVQNAQNVQNVQQQASANVGNAAANQTRQFNEADYEVAENVIEETAVSSVSADADADASFYGQTGGSYVIKRGDTLGTIAKRLLGSSQKWREIARANPSINPNRLNVGDSIVIPGAAPTQYQMSAPTVEARPLSSEPWQSAMAAPSQSQQYNQAPAAVSDPSFDPPPLMAPPPPPSAYSPYSSAPAAMDGYAPPSAPPVYTGGSMTPPPPPIGVPGMMQPPAAPYMGGPVPGPAMAPGLPVAVSTRELYREERFRIPDELKPTDFSPYFVNLNGYHGLFEVESAMLPYISTWHFGVQMKYENYRYLNSDGDVIKEGHEMIVPVHLAYAGKKFFVGMTIPFQNWEVTDETGGYKADLSGLHDPSLKLGYQVWKNLEGDHAVTVHAEGRFPGGNYQRPQFEVSAVDGETKTAAVIGPAGASRGAEVQVGAAYSGRLNEKWSSHINMALANNPEDSLTKFILRGGMDYRVNRNFAIVGELNSTSSDIDNDDQAIYSKAMFPRILANGKTSGTNVDMLVGFTLFNDDWQGSLGFPVALQKEFGYGHDFGVVFGLNHRWD